MTKEQVAIAHKEFRQALDISSMVVPSEDPNPDLFEELELIGATGSKTYAKSKQVRRQKTNIVEDNDTLRDLRNLETKYPGYRIIDYQSLRRLCSKYGLVIGLLSNYKEMIPEENIKELAQYRKDVADKLPYKTNSISYKLYGTYERSRTFLIAAPAEYFGKGLVIDGFIVPIEKQKMDWKLRIPEHNPDPIVLNELPVSGSKLYFHIASAWAVEADDEEVTNKVKVTESNN